MVTRPFEVSPSTQGRLQTIRDAAQRTLPPRYEVDLWDRRFRRHLDSVLTGGMTMLDLGSGRTPVLAASQRPVGTYYVGLDIDGDELRRAPPGSYDETVAQPAERLVPELVNRFDVVVSFFAFEHVTSTAATLENIRTYLRPGGWLIAQLAGTYSPFALANRLLPSTFARKLLVRTQHREPDSVFPAHYDNCSHTALSQLLAQGWVEANVAPLFTGAGYVMFSRTLTAAYIGYEEWAYRTLRSDLAPYYLICARRGSSAA